MDRYKIQVTQRNTEETRSFTEGGRGKGEKVKGERVKGERVNGKISYGLLMVFCFWGFVAGAQSVVSYQYDDAGNRTHRVINMPSFTPPPQDSTETVVEDLEDFFAEGQGLENEIEDDEVKSQEVYTDVLSETLITIYPNPTAGLLTVKIANLPQQPASSLTLFDMMGRVITQQQQLSDENRLDISAQPVGTYIMRIAVGGEVTSWTIVKN